MPDAPIALACDLPAVPVSLPTLQEVSALFLTFQANVPMLSTLKGASAKSAYGMLELNAPRTSFGLQGY